MDGTALFESVLAPGERLVWTGEPKQATLWLATVQMAVMTGLFTQLFVKMLHLRKTPMPIYIPLEICILMAVFVGMGLLAVRKLLRVRRTAFGLTDRRLLMAVGEERDGVRESALADIGKVTLIRFGRGDKALLFKRRDDGVFWRMLETGEADTRRPVWNVSHPEKLIAEIERLNAAANSRSAA